MNDISAASPNPECFIRRSQLYRWHLKNNAEFDTADGSVTHYADLAKESERVDRLGLADLSNLPRTGFKGPGAAEWILGNGVALPKAPNLAHAHSDSSLLVRLSHQELLVLSDLKRQSHGHQRR